MYLDKRGNESKPTLVSRVADLKRRVDVEDRAGTAGAERGRVVIELVAVGIGFYLDGTFERRAGSSLLQLSLEVVDGLLSRGDLSVELVITILWVIAMRIPTVSLISDCLRFQR